MVVAPGPTRENQRLCTLLSLGVHTDGYTTVTRRENQRVVHAARKACTTTASSGTWVAAGGGTRQLVAARGSWWRHAGAAHCRKEKTARIERASVRAWACSWNLCGGNSTDTKPSVATETSATCGWRSLSTW